MERWGEYAILSTNELKNANLPYPLLVKDSRVISKLSKFARFSDKDKM